MSISAAVGNAEREELDDGREGTASPECRGTHEVHEGAVSYGQLRVLGRREVPEEVGEGEPAKAYVIDAETGTVSGAVYEGDVLRIIRKDSMDSYAEISGTDGNGIRINKNRKFVKVFSEDVFSDCTPNEVYLLLRLAPYIQCGTGVLRQKNGVLVTRKHIVSLMSGKLSRSATDRALRDLSGKGVVLHKDFNGKKAYFVNPFVVQNGNLVNKGTLVMFAGTKYAPSAGKKG